MYKEIVERLCCPVCGRQFSLNAVKWEGEEILEGNLECSGGHCFRIAAGAGVKDACRVLKPDGELLDTFTAIEEASQAFSILKQYCVENSMEGAECIVLEQEIEKLHAEAFSQVEKQLIFEGIGDVKPEESVDLIPYWQEKYRDILLLSSK